MGKACTALVPGGEPIKMPVISRWLSAAALTRASASSHFHVPFLGSSTRHSGNRRTLVTPAAAIFGNHSSRFLKALADELTPQGVAAACFCGGSESASGGGDPRTAAVMHRYPITQNEIRLRFMNHLPGQEMNHRDTEAQRRKGRENSMVTQRLYTAPRFSHYSLIVFSVSLCLCGSFPYYSKVRIVNDRAGKV